MLGHSRELSHRSMGEFGVWGEPRWCQRSGGKGNAQGHVLSVDDVDVTRALERSTDRQHGKRAPKEGVHGVSDLDFGQVWFRWVIEGGIKVSGRSTR